MTNERMCALCGAKPARSKVGRNVRCEDCYSESLRPTICRRCHERPAVPQRGHHLCSECRLLCTRCDQPKVPNSSYCTEHRSAVGKERPRLLKTCKDCGVRFRTKAASDYCNACRHTRMKHPCADCGVLVDKRAIRCSACWGKTRRGANATNWKGGRTVMTHHGYVLQQAPGHPRAGKHGYVRQHVLVMEEQIGRYLLPGENVHHKNGQRDDNRPENLELWVKSQPAGQRVEDLLAWAHEIIARYDPSQPEE